MPPTPSKLPVPTQSSSTLFPTSTSTSTTSTSTTSNPILPKKPLLTKKENTTPLQCNPNDTKRFKKNAPTADPLVRERSTFSTTTSTSSLRTLQELTEAKAESEALKQQVFLERQKNAELQLEVEALRVSFGQQVQAKERAALAAQVQVAAEKAELARRCEELACELEFVAKQRGAEAAAEKENLRQEHSVIRVENDQLKEQLKALGIENDQLKGQLKAMALEKENLKSEHTTAINLLHTEHAGLIEQLKQANTKAISQLTNEHAGLIEQLKHQHTTEVNQLKHQHALALNQLTTQHTQALNQCNTEHTLALNQLSSTNESLSKESASLLHSLRLAESTRRALFNQVQELKGNIRVFCRIRPSKEQESGITLADEPSTLRVAQPTISATGTSATKVTTFSFDRIFAPAAGQEAVWDEVQPLVQSALDGFRVCIFAYGQTGSGKTWTMEGGVGGGGDRDLGIIPRSLYSIFAFVEQSRTLGWEYSLEASFLEIYNESIRDLLSSEGSPASNSSSSSSSFDIKHLPGGRTVITDLTVTPVRDRATIMELLSKASKARAVGETCCNQRSSRSHSLFMLSISGHNVHTGECCQGVLNLVDLAGSERLSQSGATGDRLRETQAINSSLSSLGDVISAIARGDAHVPYRNSKLTWLLQGALGGVPPGKTLMFVNVAPEQGCVAESLCSLRFAAKVNSCQIGQAKRSVR